MKRVLIIINALLVGIICLQSCLKFKSPGSILPETECASYFTSYAGMPSTGIISPSTARAMSVAYRDDIGKFFIGNRSEITNINDARAAWFDLDVIKNFIWKLEDTLCKSGCRDNLKLGLRFYYAKYPDSVQMRANKYLRDVRPAYGFRHTLFIVPAYYNEFTGKYIDFDPGKMSTSCTPQAFTFSDTLRAFILMVPLSSPPVTPGGVIQNHGGVSPPPDDEGTFGG